MVFFGKSLGNPSLSFLVKQELGKSKNSMYRNEELSPSRILLMMETNKGIRKRLFVPPLELDLVQTEEQQAANS